MQRNNRFKGGFNGSVEKEERTQESRGRKVMKRWHSAEPIDTELAQCRSNGHRLAELLPSFLLFPFVLSLPPSLPPSYRLFFLILFSSPSLSPLLFLTFLISFFLDYQENITSTLICCRLNIRTSETNGNQCTLYKLNIIDGGGAARSQEPEIEKLFLGKTGNLQI